MITLDDIREFEEITHTQEESEKFYYDAIQGASMKVLLTIAQRPRIGERNMMILADMRQMCLTFALCCNSEITIDVISRLLSKGSLATVCIGKLCRKRAVANHVDKMLELDPRCLEHLVNNVWLTTADWDNYLGPAVMKNLGWVELIVHCLANQSLSFGVFKELVDNVISCAGSMETKWAVKVVKAILGSKWCNNEYVGNLLTAFDHNSTILEIILQHPMCTAVHLDEYIRLDDYKHDRACMDAIVKNPNLTSDKICKLVNASIPPAGLLLNDSVSAENKMKVLKTRLDTKDVEIIDETEEAVIKFIQKQSRTDEEIKLMMDMAMLCGKTVKRKAMRLPGITEELAMCAIDDVELADVLVQNPDAPTTVLQKIAVTYSNATAGNAISVLAYRFYEAII